MRREPHTRKFSPCLLVGLSVIFSAMMGPKSFAATDDLAFNDCLKRYAHLPEMQPDQVWNDGALPERIKKSMQLEPSAEFIVRWEKAMNPNGTTTIIVLTRYPGSQDEDAQDLFHVLLQNRDKVSLKMIIAANASFFAKKSSDGVYGLLFCTQGDLDLKQLLLWNGQTWD
jgi:hypothetical protein